MKRLLQFLILAPVVVIGLAFAVANRHSVLVSFDPFSGDMQGGHVSVPLFLLLILAMMCGVVIGGSVTWFAQGRHRRALRDARSEAARWRKRVATPAAQPAPPSRYWQAPEEQAATQRKLLTHS
jgi:uncharacterized integral membrane protein